jgi:hypothetical protein
MEQHYFLSPIRIRVKSWIRIRMKIKNSEAPEAQNRAVEVGGRSQMEAWRPKVEAWSVCRPVVADSHHLDEEQVPDPDQH